MKFDTVHCMFEQSGTFKNQFKSMGYNSYDYDIQNMFNETDFVIDLFAEIDDAYSKSRHTVFDYMGEGDLIIAFYPCIYFSCMSQMAFSLGYRNYQCLTDVEALEKIMQRSRDREEFYERLLRFVSVCLSRKIKMVFENPWSEQTYLKANFVKAPDIVDLDRTKSGDYFAKPTAYFFFNCSPSNNCIDIKESDLKEKKRVLDMPKAKHAGLCSTDRSMIAPEYAMYFIKRYIVDGTNYDEFDLFKEFNDVNYKR